MENQPPKMENQPPKMENQPPKKRLTASTGNELINYRIKRAPCEFCMEFKEIIERQNQQISEMITAQKDSTDKITKLQETTESQNKVIVEMMADHKVLLESFQKSRKIIAAITTAFPLKNEEDLQKMEAEVNAANEEKYVSAINMLLEGNTAKNLERVFTREICMEFNAEGLAEKKRLRNYTNIYNVVLAAISQYSPTADKELKAAIQVVKKRQFRAVWNIKQKSGQSGVSE